MAAETAPIRAGDAIPIQLGDVHSFENTSSEPLELMVVGVSRTAEKRVDVVEVGAGGGGRGGRGGRGGF